MAKSKCCKATVTIMGGKTRGCTNWYECGKCGEACDVMAKSKRKRREWMAWAVVRSLKEDVPLTYDDKESAFQDSDGFEVIKVRITEVGGRRKESK